MDSKVIPTCLVKIKKYLMIIFYFLFWYGSCMSILVMSFVLTNLRFVEMGSLFFLTSLPFAIGAIFINSLKPYHYRNAGLIGIPLIAISYYVLGNYTSASNFNVFGKHGYTPLVLGVSVLLLFHVLVSIGVWMRRYQNDWSVRRTFSDDAEQKLLFEWKQLGLFEEDLSYYKYRQLLGKGIGFVAVHRHKIHASIQSLLSHKIFWFYDLLSDHRIVEFSRPDKSIQISIENYLLFDLFKRPEYQSGTSVRMIYIAQKADRKWLDFFTKTGFEFISIGSDQGIELEEKLREQVDLRIDDWRAFADLEGFFVKGSQEAFEE